MRVFPLFFATLLCAFPLRGQPQFSDQTSAASITYRNVFGGKEKQYILESHGSSAAFFDYDRDGDRNEGDGAFTDVTQASGVVPADYDSDGDSDPFVANDETPNVLFQNQGDGTFNRPHPCTTAH